MASSTPRPPTGVVLPPSFTLIDDADEEVRSISLLRRLSRRQLISYISPQIFLLYTRKLSLSSTRASSSTNGQNGSTSTSIAGLGFLSATQEVLPISLTFTTPHRSATIPSTLAVLSGEPGGKLRRVRGARKAAKGAAGREEKEVTVEFDLGQDLQALRNRKGDTGRLAHLSLAARLAVSLTLSTYRFGTLEGVVCFFLALSYRSLS
jgi:hypothetical protein